MTWKNDQVSEEETTKLLALARKSLNVEGDYVEMGCYRGDTSLLLAEILRDFNRSSTVENSVEKSVKKLWIYDSFEGLPEKADEDASALGVDFRKGELAVTKREVKARFLRAGLPVPIIKKAWFSELTGADMPERIAFAFLDGDLYESLRDSLRLVGPRMVGSGIIVVHDYNNSALPGVAKAVDEYLAGRECQTELYQSMIIIYC